ncbi:hypothetical protein [Blautia producta]
MHRKLNEKRITCNIKRVQR